MRPALRRSGFVSLRSGLLAVSSSKVETVMGAGRIDSQMAFEYAFDNIKPTDVVNVGMYRGDNDSMVEDNVAAVAKILGQSDDNALPDTGPNADAVA